MFGVSLITISTFFDEILSSFGKKKVLAGNLSKYSIGFIQMIGGLVILGLIALVKRETFVFQTGSWPTFLPRLILEILQAHAMLTGLMLADRSTFGFIRVGTVPLLLLVDIVLRYTISLPQLVGMVIILMSIFLIFFGPKINKTGSKWVIISAVNAVATLSLYKYNITNYNSVIGEQSIIQLAVILYFIAMAVFVGQENPFRYLKDKIYLTQSIINGLSNLAGSFAYAYGAASVILSAKRSSEVLWATASGGLYFREKGLAYKAIIVSLLILGLVLLVF